MKTLAALFLAVPLFAQQPESNLLQALISEVHQLRLSIERSNTVVPKMQITLTRIQMQQQKVEQRERELQAIRTKIDDAQAGRERMLTAQRQIDQQAAQSQDPAQKKQLEEAITAVRNSLEEQNLREQQGRAQESAAAGQLKVEQAKLQELEQQLDRLEKSTP
jgi:hypothetical protein